jgi:5-keto 4-deoxyuronate isomerase
LIIWLLDDFVSNMTYLGGDHMKKLLICLGLLAVTATAANAEVTIYRRSGNAVVGSDGSGFLVRDRYVQDSQGNRREIGSAGVGSNGRAYIRDGNITISNDGATYVDMGNGWSMGNNGKACYTTKGYTYCN